MVNSMDPDQTAPIGAVRSGSTLCGSILKCDSNVKKSFAADDFSRRHFQMHFFLALSGIRNLRTLKTHFQTILT